MKWRTGETIDRPVSDGKSRVRTRESLKRLYDSYVRTADIMSGIAITTAGTKRERPYADP